MSNGTLAKNFKLLEKQSDHELSKWLYDREIDPGMFFRVNNSNRWHGPDGRVWAIVFYEGEHGNTPIYYVRKI